MKDGQTDYQVNLLAIIWALLGHFMRDFTVKLSKQRGCFLQIFSFHRETKAHKLITVGQKAQIQIH